MRERLMKDGSFVMDNTRKSFSEQCMKCVHCEGLSDSCDLVDDEEGQCPAEYWNDEQACQDFHRGLPGGSK